MPITMRHVVELPLRRLSGVVESSKIEPTTRKSDGKVFNYLNIVVRVDTTKWSVEEQSAAEGWNGTVTLGYSANLSKYSDLGRLLPRLGITLGEGQSFDEASLKGMNLSFEMVRENNFFVPVLDSVMIAK